VKVTFGDLSGRVAEADRITGEDEEACMSAQPRLTPQLIRALFTEALSQEFGVRLPVEAASHDRATNLISQAMKAAPEDRERVMVCAFPEDNELWFVKKTVEVI
jgi:hypothetical protein